LPIPDALNDVTAAALPNPALSSWLPLVWRAHLKPGETVLILGATGVAGRLAVQVARHLGARRVVAVGRNPEVLKTLPDLGADTTISLDKPDRELAAALKAEADRNHFDIVLDFLWGHPTEVLLEAVTGHDVTAESRRIRLVEIGEMAGPTISLAAAALRSSGLEIYGRVVAGFRTKRFSTQSRRSGRLRSAANSALILREFLSPASRTRGYGTTYMAAGW
jgi:NADPH:quinone reductase-like Zn-dependent oxidoreductase